MRRAFCALLTVALIAGADRAATSASAASALNPELSVILPPKAFTLVNYCPDAPRAALPPTRAEVTELEARLGAILADRLNAVARSHRHGEELKVADYYRQYSALVIGARRLIHVNGFHRFLVEGNSRAPDWRNVPVCVFDGGERFFGVEYDPETKTFSNFAFHGEA